MFTYKTQEEVDKMSASEYETYTTQKNAHEADQRKQVIDKAISEATKNSATKAEIEALTEKQNAIVKELENATIQLKKLVNVNAPMVKTKTPKVISPCKLDASQENVG